MDTPRKAKCGLRLKRNSPPNMAFRAMRLMDPNNLLTSNSLLTSNLHNSVIQEAINRCRPCNTQACKGWAKGTLRQAEDSTQIQAHSNLCKQLPPVRSQELRAGHRNHPQDQAGLGAGRDSRNDTITSLHENNR
jgi:hypothetical protein